MAADDRSTVSGRSTPNADEVSSAEQTRRVGSRRAARPAAADAESTMVMRAVTTRSSQTYEIGRRAKAPEPVAAGTSKKRPEPTPLLHEDTIVFPAVGSLPEGRIPGARRARARAATRSAARGRITGFAGAAAIAVAAIGSLIASPVAFLAGQDASLAQSYVGARNATNAVDVSRNYDRELAVQQPLQAQQIATALAQSKASVVKSAQKRQADIIRNQWVLPVVGYRLTARFGQGGGYWSSGRHTGLDFAGPSGTPIAAVAGGVVTSAGYEGAYGNRTIITLADGTEIWYCHQSSIQVSVGQQIAPGDPIGHTGSTGNVTGPHLHLEVHPGGGDPVDPYSQLVAHGVTP